MHKLNLVIVAVFAMCGIALLTASLTSRTHDIELLETQDPDERQEMEYEDANEGEDFGGESQPHQQMTQQQLPGYGVKGYLTVNRQRQRSVSNAHPIIINLPPGYVAQQGQVPLQPQPQPQPLAAPLPSVIKKQGGRRAKRAARKADRRAKAAKRKIKKVLAQQRAQQRKLVKWRRGVKRDIRALKSQVNRLTRGLKKVQSRFSKKLRKVARQGKRQAKRMERKAARKAKRMANKAERKAKQAAKRAKGVLKKITK